MKMTADEKDVYTTANVAEMIGVHPKTIRRWIRDGKIRPVFRVPGRWGRKEYRIPASTLRDFVEVEPAVEEDGGERPEQ